MTAATAPGGARALDDVIAGVGQVRAHVVDAWEATALIESLGYTDARVRREFGLADTRALGECVFGRLSGGRAPVPLPDTAGGERRQTFTGGVAANWVYAVAWLAAFVVDRTVSDSLRASDLPPLALPLICSLIVTGGFVHAMIWRARLYLGFGQPAFAAFVCGYFLRLGAIVTAGATAVGVIIGWALLRFPWPYLVLAADEFVILSALWLACGVFAVRREYWRVLGAFVIGALGFVLVHQAGFDWLTARLVALGGVIAAAVNQLPRVFTRLEGVERTPSVPIPRLSILFWRASPFFWYGTAYFCLLFLDRFLASGDERLAIDLALLSFLIAAAAIEHGTNTFAHQVDQAASLPFTRGSGAFRRVVGRSHLQALAMAAGAFLVTSTIVGGLTSALFRGTWTHVGMMLTIGDAGCLLLALGVTNTAVLFALNRPWSAVKPVAASLVINAATAWVLSLGADAHYATAGLLVSGIWIFVQSTIAVRQTVARGEQILAAA